MSLASRFRWHSLVISILFTATRVRSQTTNFDPGKVKVACDNVSNVMFICWTDTNLPFTAPSLVSCICQPAANTPVSEWHSKLDFVWPVCASYYGPLSPQLASTFSEFNGYCSKFDTPGGVVATSTEATTSSSSSPSPTTESEATTPSPAASASQSIAGPTSSETNLPQDSSSAATGTSTPAPGGGSKPPVGAIVGGAIGGVIAVAALVLGAFFLGRRGKRQGDKQPDIAEAPAGETKQELEQPPGAAPYVPPANGATTTGQYAELQASQGGAAELYAPPVGVAVNGWHADKNESAGIAHELESPPVPPAAPNGMVGGYQQPPVIGAANQRSESQYPGRVGPYSETEAM